MAQYDLNLRDYWRIFRRRKGIIAIVTLAFGAMAYTFAEVQKPHPIYQATAVVKFERATTLVGLLVETISLSSGDNITTQAAVVRSFSVLERAAKGLGLIPADLDSEAVKRNPQYVQFLSDLRSQVATAPEENTTLINITVTSPGASQAARIANAVAQAYREENTLGRNRQIREARRFIEEQLAEVGGRLQRAEHGIRALKESRGFVSLSEETTALLTRLHSLESGYQKVRQTQEETANQIQALQDPQVAAGIVAPRIFTDAGDPTIGRLNATLLDLFVERENSLQTLMPAHPQVRDLNARIATTRESLVRELRLKVRTFQGREADLQRQIQQARQEQRGLPDVAQQYAQLQRDMTINENLLTQLRTKLQEVQIKEKEQVEEVALVRPATEPTWPTNPAQTAGKGVVGLLIGLTIGLVLAFVLESMDTSIGTIQDVEGYLDVPVVGLIPNIDPSRDPSLAPPRRRGRRQRPHKDAAVSRLLIESEIHYCRGVPVPPHECGIPVFGERRQDPVHHQLVADGREDDHGDQPCYCSVPVGEEDPFCGGRPAPATRPPCFRHSPRPRPGRGYRRQQVLGRMHQKRDRPDAGTTRPGELDGFSQHRQAAYPDERHPAAQPD